MEAVGSIPIWNSENLFSSSFKGYQAAIIYIIHAEMHSALLRI